MDAIVVYLDESGDLGWKLDQPYRAGGSSRFLTLGAVIVAAKHKHLPKRIVRALYKARHRNPGNELKWADLDVGERLKFCQNAAKLASDSANSVSMRTITVCKANVQAHIRADPNKLYNYMIGVLLLPVMAKARLVTLVPDPRTVKVKSGNSLHDYLQTKLWFEFDAETTLVTNPSDSIKTTNIQFADMLCGAIQGHFEDGVQECIRHLRPAANIQKLFF
ncbi:MAG: DUF3800 domain-containing protein [Gammaproteobacteria bacterium]